MKKEIRVYVESELRDYHQIKQDLRVLREDILNESPTPPDGMPRSTEISDPTYRKTQKLLTSRQIKYLANLFACVTEVLNELPPEKYELVKVTYWTKPQTLTPVGIALKLNCGRNTYYRWRDEICEEIARKLGILR